MNVIIFIQSLLRIISRKGTKKRIYAKQYINRGVLTGYNEAFVIDTAKRNEIPANCKTEAERKRAAELIRPFYVKSKINLPMSAKSWFYVISCG